MSGKIAGIVIMVVSLLAGIGIWYTENYAYYETVAAEAVALHATLFDGTLDPLLIENVEAIDAETSPLRFRACFTTPMSLAMMTETYQPYEGATPLNTPGWFECYDAGALTAQLESGEALAFLGEANFIYGLDRIIAVTASGQGYAWHQLNDCGEAVYSGDPAPFGCPPEPERN